jgi:hypothetical protein
MMVCPRRPVPVFSRPFLTQLLPLQMSTSRASSRSPPRPRPRPPDGAPPVRCLHRAVCSRLRATLFCVNAAHQGALRCRQSGGADAQDEGPRHGRHPGQEAHAAPGQPREGNTSPPTSSPGSASVRIPTLSRTSFVPHHQDNFGFTEEDAAQATAEEDGTPTRARFLSPLVRLVDVAAL